ncbi:proteasome assembly chaperone 4-like [Littorina saxatilis]|uniref:Proteasome assembly chaperone 4 n=1 Tax=Littorina saxatilis TaxID=31220 RepID=A0AAN9GNK4_9CAEN
MEGNDETNVESIHPLISVHNFEDNILGNQIYFHVIKLSESFHICVGTAAVMKNMAVAMQTKYNKGSASGNALFGDAGDTVSLNMAQKLAQKTGKQVFVSCSVPYDQNLIPLVEKRISDEIKSHPQHF